MVEALRELSKLVAPYTKTSEARRFAMIEALGRVDKIPGDIVESGVWRGGNIMLARKVLPDRVCWLYDTFAGMTAPGPEDKRRGGTPASVSYDSKKAAGIQWCGASLEEVRGHLAEMGVLDDTKLRFVVGDVRETLLDPSNLPEQIAILRLDTDWYASTKVELEILYPRLVNGGFLIVDDYGHWQGSRLAVDNYFGTKMRIDWIDDTAIMIRKT